MVTRRGVEHGQDKKDGSSNKIDNIEHWELQDLSVANIRGDSCRHWHARYKYLAAYKNETRSGARLYKKDIESLLF
jgi:hypothetical protein